MSDRARVILNEYICSTLEEFNSQVETRLRDLVMHGFSMSDLSIRQDGDRLQIWILNLPDSEFWVQGTETGVSINGRSIRPNGEAE